MSYVKLNKAIRDYALGFQDVNQASNNELAIREAYAVEHVGALSGYQVGFASQSDSGHHNHVTIPRAVAVVHVEQLATIVGTIATYQVSFEVSSPNVIKSVTRAAAGVYWIAAKGLALDDAWGEGHAQVSASGVVRRALVRRKAKAITSTTVPGNGFMVYLLERNSGSGEFEAADFSFAISIFSTDP